jgi:hypothetical protein
MLEPCDAKVSSTVLRGPGDRKVAWLLGHAESIRQDAPEFRDRIGLPAT